MKSLKFTSELSEKILAGKKTGTWRLFDDKNLELGDELELINKSTDEVFARAKITSLKFKKLGEVTKEEIAGKYKDFDEMYRIQKGHYGDKVDENTEVKMIEFKLI
ncbi:ASCH domain-containing protein [Candidatus Nomurabacteria bacterium]|nr:ASCH domain-containing protein [Candidatus Nomurabacteria bacterium]USN94602.1 MAG: ASCH domain-containing protein [Candidatus Nomurabacteria bacterium]